jgi:hypothetical protein
MTITNFNPNQKPESRIDSETVFLFDQVYRSKNKDIEATANELNISVEDAQAIDAVLNDNLEAINGKQLTIFDLLET